MSGARAAHGPRRVVVSGAARGIGLAVCRRFLTAGDRVVGLDVDAAALADAVAALRAEFPDAVRGVAADVADAESVHEAFAALAADGAVHVLVNNAAVVQAQPFVDTTPAQWREVLSVNLDGAFHCVQAALPLMPDGGRIVNLSSHSAARGSRNRAAYAASKGGLEALTRVLAVELAARGITVNAVAPGPVDTADARARHSAARRQAWAAALPVARYGTAEEIAEAVYFLAAGHAAFITGQVLAVDGGFSAAGLISIG